MSLEDKKKSLSSIDDVSSTSYTPKNKVQKPYVRKHAQKTLEVLIERVEEVYKLIKRWHALIPFFTSFIFFASTNYIILDTRTTNRIDTALSSTFIQQQTDSGIGYRDIETTADWWEWFDEVIFKQLFSPESELQNAYLIKNSNLLLGGIRLRQTQATEEGRYCYDSHLEEIWSVCLGNVKEAEAVPIPSDLKNYPYNLTSEEYVIQFFYGADLYDSQVLLLEELKNMSWINPATRDIEIELGFFNTNTRFFGAMEFRTSFYAEGSVSNRNSLSILRVDPYNFNFVQNKIRFAFEIIWIAVLIPIVLHSVNLYRIGKLNLKIIKYHRAIRIFHLFVHVVLIANWLYFVQDDTRKLLEDLHHSGHDVRTELGEKNFSINFRSLAVWKESKQRILFVEMILYTIRSVNFFRVSIRGEILVKSLLRALPEILSFMPIYFAFSFGFALTGMFLFGQSYVNWRNIPEALFTVFEMNLGLYDTDSLFVEEQLYSNNLNRFSTHASETSHFTMIFLYTVLTVNGLILLNFFLAIVVGAFDTITSEKERLEEQKLKHLPPIKQAKVFKLVARIIKSRMFLKRTLSILKNEEHEAEIFEPQENKLDFVLSEPREPKPLLLSPEELLDLLRANDNDTVSFEPWFLSTLLEFLWDTES
eukprot:maker-scaffold_7-snap-gene-14.7-mRNA-1 protein AED:0.21 eAED:0.21 QI:146/1/1/1/1/1/3/391/646